ncbi:MAG TPA: hypothetical protein VLA37_13030, partial [Sphingomonadaceae bacterium]|nr:hypothetical protein [Sphingomonadaceae bacterium]
AIERLVPRSTDEIVRSFQRAGAHFMAGDLEKALESNQRSLMLNPRMVFGLKDRVIYLEKLGRRAEALMALQETKAAWPGLTLEHVERLHINSVLAPSVAQDFFQTFAKVWHAAEEAEAKQ